MKKSRFSTRLSDGCAHIAKHVYLNAVAALPQNTLTLCTKMDGLHNSCGNFKVIIMLHLRNRFTRSAIFTGFRFFFLASLSQQRRISLCGGVGGCGFSLIHKIAFCSCEHAHYFSLCLMSKSTKILKFVYPIILKSLTR